MTQPGIVPTTSRTLGMRSTTGPPDVVFCDCKINLYTENTDCHLITTLITLQSCVNNLVPLKAMQHFFFNMVL